MPDLETQILPFRLKLMGRLASARTRRAAVLGAADYTLMALIALGWLARGDRDGAQTLAKAAEQARQRAGHDHQPGTYWGLLAFIDVLVSHIAGDAARAHMLCEAAARDYGQSCPSLVRILGELQGRRLELTQPLLGQPFPCRYNLPQSDPFGQWPDGPDQGLDATLAGLRPGQWLAVCLLGPYRTNGPMQAEVESLIALHRHDPQRIGAIHLITEAQPVSAANSNRWASRNQIEDEARAAGLPFAVLSDHKGEVAAMLAIDSAPTIFLLDHEGRVLSQQSLTETGGGWWLALMRTGSRAPAAESSTLAQAPADG